MRRRLNASELDGQRYTDPQTCPAQRIIKLTCHLLASYVVLSVVICCEHYQVKIWAVASQITVNLARMAVS